MARPGFETAAKAVDGCSATYRIILVRFSPIPGDTAESMRGILPFTVTVITYGRSKLMRWRAGWVVNELEGEPASVSARLDPQVLDWLRSKGQGHLTRINDILSNLMEAERRIGPGR